VIAAMTIPILLSSFWRGDGSCFVSVVRCAILPSSVFCPVANTMALADPCVTTVPMNTVLTCSIFGRNLPRSVIAFFVTGNDSPVRMASSISSLLSSIILASAGILSPACSINISPGTTCLAGISLCCPFLSTRALDEVKWERASIAFSALYFWKKLNSALITTITPITIASVVSLKR